MLLYILEHANNDKDVLFNSCLWFFNYNMAELSKHEEIYFLGVKFFLLILISIVSTFKKWKQLKGHIKKNKNNTKLIN